MTDVTRYLAAAATAELEDWGPLAEATGQPMQTRGLDIWQDEDQGLEVGVWECTSGPSYWTVPAAYLPGEFASSSALSRPRPGVHVKPSWPATNCIVSSNARCGSTTGSPSAICTVSPSSRTDR
jgi:hypothetical protein